MTPPSSEAVLDAAIVGLAQDKGEATACSAAKAAPKPQLPAA